eukprot:gene1553-1644_t
MLYNFYIYNRKGKCLYYREWNRPLNTLSDDTDEEKRLMFGMLFSLKDLASKLSPSQGENLHVVKTDNFTLHHYQSLSGFVFVINTRPEVPDLYGSLQHIYSNIFVEYIVRNPLYHFKVDEPLNCPLFVAKVEEYLFSLPPLK